MMESKRQTNVSQLIAEWAEQNRLSSDEKERIRRSILMKKTGSNLEWLPYLYENINFFLRLNQDTIFMKRHS
jgi:hypothetical protein